MKMIGGKLIKMMCYLKNTHKDVMVISANDSSSIVWHVDAAFAVHNDKKSHTGATMLLGGVPELFPSLQNIK
jgi:hypothetical protein